MINKGKLLIFYRREAIDELENKIWKVQVKEVSKTSFYTEINCLVLLKKKINKNHTWLTDWVTVGQSGICSKI